MNDYNTEILKVLENIKKDKKEKFDSSIDIAFHLNVNTKKAEQQIRTTGVLPQSNGTVRNIYALSSNSAQFKEFIAKGAKFAGDENDLKEFIQQKKLKEIDTIITIPEMMKKIARFGKDLGPKGLMPNVKERTVGDDLLKILSEFSKGKINIKTDKLGNVHIKMGKTSFDNKVLLDNIVFTIKKVISLKPATIKGTFIKKISLSSSMGKSHNLKVSNFNV